MKHQNVKNQIKITPEELLALVFILCGEKGKAPNEKTFKYTTKLQKLVFLALYDQQIEDKNKTDYIKSLQQEFNFKPYHYGPYSQKIQVLLDIKFKDTITYRKLPFTFGDEYKYDENNLEKFLNKETIKKLVQSDKDRFYRWLGMIEYFGKKDLPWLLEYVYKNPEYQSFLTSSKIVSKYRSI
jgi:hypothetical protein